FPVEVIDEPVRGRGRARNTAWRHCRTPFIAFTDADCTVSVSWLKELMPAFEDPGIAIVGGDIVTPGDDVLARFFELRQIVSNLEFSGDYPYSPPFLATANAVFRISAIEAVSGFQENYRVAEDADICWRITAMGYHIRYTPNAFVFHHHRTTVAQLFRQAVDYGHDGVHVILTFRPEIRFWIWSGLYFRWMIAFAKLPLSPFFRSQFTRKLPVLDLIRYSGLILGRLSAAWETRRFII
ncbi:MAG TPA: glycosyltransferase family 2 protein, partial [bacterium]|nr:glycosyltransferase family 2 protein [bacterium]